jgi:hypothetical protein
MVALMNEAKELQDILKNLQQRFIRWRHIRHW